MGVPVAPPPVRVIEEGDVRAVVEADFAYGRSFAAVRYIFPKQGGGIEISIDLICAEQDTMMKIAFPAVLENQEWLAETMFGVEAAFMDGREVVSHRFDVLKGEDGRSVSVLNDCVYGGSFLNGVLYKNLLRTPAYCAHPIEARPVLPQDRFVPRMEYGRSVFHFRIVPGGKELSVYDLAKEAQVMNEPPMAVSFFPSGERDASSRVSNEAFEKPGEVPPVSVEGRVLVSALCRESMDESNGDFTLRLYEPAGEPTAFSIHCPAYGIQFHVQATPFEIKTFCLSSGGITEKQFAGI